MDKINQLLERRVEKIYPSKKALEKVLRSGKKIRLYIGIDPTATRLHLGHTIGIRKLQEFANLGHKAIFLFGDGTVLVGDPSERERGRKLISQQEVKENMKNWKEQMKPFLDFSKIKEKHNADWLTKLNLIDIINIGSKVSAVQLFKRDNFQKRLNRRDTVWFHETMYPLLQGYDSVAMDVDLEIGGTDQTFNMLVGRELQKKLNNKEKFVLTVKMILGTDGKKMSKTSNNCIWLTDSPIDIYGKVMKLQDQLIPSYFEAFTDITNQELEKIKKELKNSKTNPMVHKQQLAYEITKQVHGKTKAEEAEKDFIGVFQKRTTPKKIKTFDLNNLSSNPIKPHLLLIETDLVSTANEAKLLINQKAMKLNNTYVLKREPIKIKTGDIISVGKKRWLKIV